MLVQRLRAGAGLEVLRILSPTQASGFGTNMYHSAHSALAPPVYWAASVFYRRWSQHSPVL